MKDAKFHNAVNLAMQIAKEKNEKIAIGKVNGIGWQIIDCPTSTLFSKISTTIFWIDENGIILNTQACLAPKQKIVFDWFLKQGLSGKFNRNQIQKDTKISHPTIRKCVSKLCALDLIDLKQYNPVLHNQEYTVNPHIEIIET